MATRTGAGAGLIAIGIVSVALAAWLTWRALSPAPALHAVGRVPAASESVVVATRTIPAFSVIPSGSLTLRRYPDNLVPKGALTALSMAVGKFTTTRIPAGEPVVQTDLTDPGNAPLISALLKPGEAAVSVTLGAAQASGGWLRPGISVTLYAVTARTAVQLVAQARVLAVNGQVNPGVATSSGATAVVTLAVPQSAVPAVLEAAAANSLQAVLMPAGDV